MSPRLVTAILAKDEAARDLRVCIGRCLEFSDEVLLLDDGSTDQTPKIAEEMGCLVKHRVKPGAWGNESAARQELWERGAKLAKDGWLLIADADMILHGDPRPLCETWDLTGWAFILRDLWSDSEFRVDGPWAAGPQFARPWLFRPSACPKPEWNPREIHTGHCPSNFPLAIGVAPPDTYWWEHRAYLTAERRVTKHAQYMSKKDLLSPQEFQHAMSIIE